MARFAFRLARVLRLRTLEERIARAAWGRAEAEAHAAEQARGLEVDYAVLTDVAPGMPAYHEELFGPVAAIIPVADEEEAIRVANDTEFGLGAAIFTRDEARGHAIARDRLEAGACFVNAFVRSDPRLPFGGIKTSGYGRELGRLGIREFVNAKTVCVYG